MTPFELDILLHYYGCADDHPVIERNPPIWPETRNAFISEKLLEAEPCVAPPGYPQRTYRLTPRGRAYVKFVLAVPLPEQSWVLPDAKAWPEIPDAASSERKP